MSKSLRLFLNAVVNGLIATIGAIVAVWSGMEPGQTLADMPMMPIYIACGTGALTALKDIQSFLSSSD